ncbi:MAG: type II toxin-antitoxin system VapB family antitoxin [Treponema sp.]|nr:type II toxin-antitoxin system VapB family antitoxin [Treponema sp.]
MPEQESLVKEAMQITGIQTENEVIIRALKEYIRLNRQLEILKYKGSHVWEGNLEEMRSV